MLINQFGDFPPLCKSELGLIDEDCIAKVELTSPDSSSASSALTQKLAPKDLDIADRALPLLTISRRSGKIAPLPVCDNPRARASLSVRVCTCFHVCTRQSTSTSDKNTSTSHSASRFCRSAAASRFTYFHILHVILLIHGTQSAVAGAPVRERRLFHRTLALLGSSPAS